MRESSDHRPLRAAPTCMGLSWMSAGDGEFYRRRNEAASCNVREVGCLSRFARWVVDVSMLVVNIHESRREHSMSIPTQNLFAVFEKSHLHETGEVQVFRRE